MLFKVIEVKTFSFDSHCSKIPIFIIKKRYKGLNFNKNVTRYLYVVVNCFAYYVNSSICYMLCVNHLKGSVELKDAVQNLSSDQSMLQILLSSKNRPEGHPQNKDPSSMKHASTVGPLPLHCALVFVISLTNSFAQFFSTSKLDLESAVINLFAVLHSKFSCFPQKS